MNDVLEKGREFVRVSRWARPGAALRGWYLLHFAPAWVSCGSDWQSASLCPGLDGIVNHVLIVGYDLQTPMDFVIIPLISAMVAALTLVSGFGLGTLLLPAFAIFFPIEIAIAATAVVHFANNLFKLAIVGKWADRGVVLRFGVPAIFAAFVGAALMTYMANIEPLHTYQLGRIHASITWLKLVIAALLAVFAALELWPRYQQISFPPTALPVGGMLSGFFGGISGMQGALRAPFLLRAGLKEKSYVGTANVISTIVDVARLAVYAVGFAWLAQEDGQHGGYAALTESRTMWLVAIACVAGFLGSYLGAKVVTKVTLHAIRILVAALLFIAAAALGAGVA